MKTTVHVTETSIFATGSALAPRRPLAAGSAVSSTHWAEHCLPTRRIVYSYTAQYNLYWRFKRRDRREAVLATQRVE